MQEARLLENEPGLLPGGLDKELVGQVGEGSLQARGGASKASFLWDSWDLS